MLDIPSSVGIYLSSLSSFLGPAHTSIHLIQLGVMRLIQNFPFHGITDALTTRYNALADRELIDIRNFLVLHYTLNRRQSGFWKDRASQALPDSLRERMELFQQNALTFQVNEELFRVDSWIQVMRGQGLESRGWHRYGAILSEEQMMQALGGVRQKIARAVDQMPSHAEFVKAYCAAPPQVS